MLIDVGRSIRITFVIVLTLSTVTMAQKPSTSHNREIAQWDALIPTIKAELDKNRFDCKSNWQIRVVDAVDLTGDGVPDAIIDWCNGGAYTDWLVLMRLEAGSPIIARVRRKDGEYAASEFADGASVMHSVAAELHPEERAIYDIRSDPAGYDDKTGEPKGIKRVVSVYVWNQKTKTFDWNAALSKEE